jgi:hypothetical protein
MAAKKKPAPKKPAAKKLPPWLGKGGGAKKGAC